MNRSLKANRLIGAISSHDISVPLGSVPDFIAQAGPALAALGDYRINCFGHRRGVARLISHPGATG